MDADDQQASAGGQAASSPGAASTPGGASQPDSERFAQDLRDALLSVSTTGIIAAPITSSELLESIAQTAAHITAAEACFLFLNDPGSRDLVFTAGYGAGVEHVERLKLRVSRGQGVVGLVAVRGQPVALSGADLDPNLASAAALAAGYSPRAILCMPIKSDQQVIGVLELLDKDGYDSFQIADMTTLGLLATQAAIAIEQSRTYGSIRGLLGLALESLSGAGVPLTEALQNESSQYAARLEQSTAFQAAVEMANLISEIARHGSDELEMCRGVLREFAAYVERKRRMEQLEGVADL